MKTMIRIPTLLAGALLLGSAHADVSYTEAEKLRTSGDVLPTARVTEIAAQAKAGEVTDLELDRDLGRYVYEVEVRDAQGQEWDLEIDAKSGEILHTDVDD